MARLKGENSVHGHKAVLLSIKSLILVLGHSSGGLNQCLDTASKAFHGAVHACPCDLALANNATYNCIHAVPLGLCTCSSLSVECLFPHCFSDLSLVVLSNTSVKLPLSASPGLFSVPLKLPNAPPSLLALNPRLLRPGAPRGILT